jgi:hypothetical protein
MSSYSVVLESAPVDQLPLVATDPCQPPEAVQAVALTECQCSVDVPPSVTVDGDADRVVIRADDTTTFVDPDPEPLEPVQVSV